MKYAKQAQILRMSTASISLLASSTIGFMILRSRKGLKSPYSRIIFGLSVADTVQSLAFILSPFAAPSDTPGSFWAVGTTKTCDYVGWFLVLCGPGVPFYVLFLTFYFLMRVKYKVQPKQFAQKTEWKIHLFIWLWGLVSACYAVAKGQINATRYGSLCLISAKPFGCWTVSEDACVRGKGAALTSQIVTNIPLLITFVILMCVLTALNCYVYIEEKKYPVKSNRNQEREVGEQDSDAIQFPVRNPILQNNFMEGSFLKSKQNIAANNTVSATQQESNLSNEAKVDDPQCDEDNIAKNNDETNAKNNDETNDDNESISSIPSNFQRKKIPARIKESIVKQSLTQSMLYIVAFLVTYSVPVIVRIMIYAKADIGEWSFWALSILYPIGGLWNILIYTRPKIHQLKRKQPELGCWFNYFFRVLSSGGEVPSEHEYEDSDGFLVDEQERARQFQDAFMILAGLDPIEQN